MATARSCQRDCEREPRQPDVPTGRLDCPENKSMKIMQEGIIDGAALIRATQAAHDQRLKL
jgi:hypothetical protein